MLLNVLDFLLCFLPVVLSMEQHDFQLPSAFTATFQLLVFLLCFFLVVALLAVVVFCLIAILMSVQPVRETHDEEDEQPQILVEVAESVKITEAVDNPNPPPPVLPNPEPPPEDVVHQSGTNNVEHSTPEAPLNTSLLDHEPVPCDLGFGYDTDVSDDGMDFTWLQSTTTADEVHVFIDDDSDNSLDLSWCQREKVVHLIQMLYCACLRYIIYVLVN